MKYLRYYTASGRYAGSQKPTPFSREYWSWISAGHEIRFGKLSFSGSPVHQIIKQLNKELVSELNKPIHKL
jgi:hypothetical protein